MSDLHLIESALARAASRRRWERAFRGLWQGVLVGSLIFLTALAAYKLLPLPYATLVWAGAASIVAAAMGMILGGWRRTSLAEIARWVDGKQHLQERLSTALEVGQVSGDGAWRDLIVSDAANHAKGLDPRKLINFGLPRASRWALLVLALCAGLGFVPEYRTHAYVQKQAEQKNIKETGRQLADLTKRNLQARKPVLETTEKSMEAVKDLGEQLTGKNLTRNEALKDLANITDKLKDQINDLAKDPAIQRMQQAARTPTGSTSPEVARLQKQIEDAQKELGNPTGTPEDMDKMKQALEKIEQAAKGAADKNGNMSQADKDKISQSMAALSKQAQEMGMQMPSLDAAIQALEAAQTGMFLKDLEASVTDLEKMKELAKSIEQMQAQMDKAGKDLAEQLKFGQAEAAQTTLQKMTQQLKSGNPTPEQLQKMLAEVSKAVDPASPYGKVAEHLKSAVGQLQKGEKPGAAQSLAAAAEELNKMMGQMNDAKALMAEMKALQTASLCVGTCQGWGTCNNPGFGMKPGGKPGSGVGTWADENSGWGYTGAKTATWDNSGLGQRPDMASRGISDRGDGELNPALRPDKVKGQFSPGGQMPSITLKGISIKGQSKVAYEEAAAAAQVDAQSALSQEKVPRAYQGAVKDYFDDLKK